MTMSRERHGYGCRSHERQDACGIGAGLRFYVCPEYQRDNGTNRGKDQHQRSRGPRPVGCHTVARKIPRHDIQETRHGGGPSEPQNEDCTDVVERAKAIAEELVEDCITQEQEEAFIFEMVKQGNSVDGLYPMNADWQAKYQEWKAGNADD